jgi:hypothetical protein
MRVLVAVLAFVAMILVPDTLLAQGGSLSGFRSYLFVLVAYGAGWLLIGTWVFQMSRRLRRVSDQLDKLGQLE